MARRKSAEKPQVVGFLGVGLDEKDGVRRVTRSENFLLVGGSAETHDRMQKTVIRFDESLESRGQRLRDIPPEVALDLLREAMDR